MSDVPLTKAGCCHGLVHWLGRTNECWGTFAQGPHVHDIESTDGNDFVFDGYIYLSGWATVQTPYASITTARAAPIFSLAVTNSNKMIRLVLTKKGMCIIIVSFV